jgi:CBS domain-containing protein
MPTVAEILKAKADPSVYTIGPAHPVDDVARAMAEHNTSALIVVDGESIVGIVTERDLARSTMRGEGKAPMPQVRQLMSTEVLTVRPDQTSSDCMALMAQKHLRHLPVVDDGKLVGMISIRDLMYELVEDRGIRMANIVKLIAPKTP